MYPNLIYNGDFQRGTESFSGTGIEVCSEGGITVTGNLHQNNLFMPVSSSRRYRLSYDLKFNSADGTNGFYIALYPYDSKKTLISNYTTNKRANTMTTLTSELKAGDTTVQIASATGWTTGFVGIYDNKAYGETRADQVLTFSSISGTTVTLSSAYSGSTKAVGTKVANNFGSGTYYYPHSLSKANLPTTWTTYTVEFNGGDAMRATCKYFTFHTLGYSHNYSVRNLCIECISDYQEPNIQDVPVKPNISKQSVANGLMFNSVGMDIRYIRDTITGNTVNTSNHWNEVQAFNYVGENIAFAHDVSINGTVYANSCVTDGVVDSSWLGVNSGTKSLLIDLGYVERVDKIIIWHYYPDGRTYSNNITEVSQDGTNWITVYSGTKPETPEGNIINLSPHCMSIADSGEISCNEIIEW